MKTIFKDLLELAVICSICIALAYMLVYWPEGTPAKVELKLNASTVGPVNISTLDPEDLKHVPNWTNQTSNKTAEDYWYFMINTTEYIPVRTDWRPWWYYYEYPLDNGPWNESNIKYVDISPPALFRGQELKYYDTIKKFPHTKDYNSTGYNGRFYSGELAQRLAMEGYEARKVCGYASGVEGPHCWVELVLMWEPQTGEIMMPGSYRIDEEVD
jgi:hypothetical protein